MEAPTENRNETLVSALHDTQEALAHYEYLASFGQMVAGLALEMNNPLTIISLYAHMLYENSERYPEFRDDVKMILEQTERCKSAMGWLLDFSQKKKLNRHGVDIRTIIAKAVEMAGLPESIRVRMVDELNSPDAEVDGRQMVLALSKVIGNAAAAMTSGGILTITLTDAPSWFSVAFNRTGVGRDDIVRILEPLGEPDATHAERMEMWVAKGIIYLHGGTLSIELNDDVSSVFSGTTIAVKFPRREAVELSGRGSRERKTP